jgi:signal transduction histidine kinase
MSHERLPTRSLRKLAIVLLVVMIPPAATLIWLGFQLLDQDRSLLEKDIAQRQTVAKAAAESLKASLEGAERTFVPGVATEGVARVMLTADTVVIDPPMRLLWTPLPAPLASSASEPFAEAEVLENRQGEDQALAIYERLAKSTVSTVRAGASMRLARLRRGRHEWDAALDAYQSLIDMRAVGYNSVPVDLLARRGICGVLKDAGRAAGLASEAESLARDLVAGRWTIDGPTWRQTEKEVQQWIASPLPITNDERVLSGAVAALWTQRSGLPDRSGEPTRRLVLNDPAQSMALVRSDGKVLTALIVLPGALRSWIEKAARVSPGERLALRNATGVLAGMEPLSGSMPLEQTVEATPWTLVLSPKEPQGLIRALARRRQLLALGLASVLALLLGGGYVLWRVVRREVIVARQQAEFVSAVSHEFRTPLTSLRHVTELLQETDDMPEERRRSFYAALGRNTSRLHRLVESLLDFARMESGRRPYTMRTVDVSAFVNHVVAEFQESLDPGRATVIVESTPVSQAWAGLDVSAMTTTLWNLLDNSVKYSDGCAMVRVDVRQRSRSVIISVTDSGFGIPESERAELFQRFVRGRKAQELRIAGTGLGLAIVAHVVRTHGGRVEVESEVGKGSTFTIALPACDSEAGVMKGDQSAA